ncbi:Peptidase family M20/M25/M40 [Pannonibacter indicus]|uniref:Peptidase family M20/M25/M40 n=1 Tax=Pannonibacter indicus TaxID=466044 RepID=A0A0K6HY94_9HYPH|nr:Peptidase family M20/M25/M40 [Pannonibacter indicus]
MPTRVRAAHRWREGLSPFVLTREEDKLYGRSTACNNVQHLINLKAMELILKENGRLGFNAKVIIEMAEETGSYGLRDFFEEKNDLLASDILIASDGPRLAADTPAMFMGSRGGMGIDLTVDLRP